MMGGNEQTPALPDQFAVIAEHLVANVGRCTCDGPFETYGHRPECGYEPVMTLDELAVVLSRAGRTVLEPSTEEQWCHFYGGPDPDNAAGNRICDDEVDAREASEWVVTLGGKGIARRQVSCGPWEVVDFTSDLPASGSSGDGEPDGTAD